MEKIYEEVLIKLKTDVPELRYVNWDLGQLNGFYEKPPVTFPCALLSFVQIGYEDLGNLNQLGDCLLNIKIGMDSFSSTSSISPATVRAKGNMIWTIERKIFKSLQGYSGQFFNTISRKGTRTEDRDDGLNVLNSVYAFTMEDKEASPVFHTISPMGIDLNVSIDLDPIHNLVPKYVADFATFNSDTFLNDFCNNGNKYGYEVLSVGYNTHTLDGGYKIAFERPDRRFIPVQVYPFNTIPNHTIEGLTFDKNWLTFLNNTPICEFLEFKESAIGGMPDDAGFPYNIICGTNSIPPLDPITDACIYGEGFQIIWNKGDTFSIEIAYLYYNSHEDEFTNHTVEFTEHGTYYDGALVPIINKRLFYA